MLHKCLVHMDYILKLKNYNFCAGIFGTATIICLIISVAFTITLKNGKKKLKIIDRTEI